MKHKKVLKTLKHKKEVKKMQMMKHDVELADKYITSTGWLIVRVGHMQRKAAS